MINSSNVPIYDSSAFYFNSMQNALDAFNFKTTDYVYSRGNNPTLRELEMSLSKLVKGEDAVCFSSGMGAISTAMLSLLGCGDIFYIHMCYMAPQKNCLRSIIKIWYYWNTN